MKKIYNSKAFWMIVSLLASLAIWVYVTSVETDESKTTFRGVKVELVGEDILRDSKNLVVTDMDTSTVTVEVVGALSARSARISSSRRSTSASSHARRTPRSSTR